ncbi:MAG: hypothetical protein ACOX8U_07665 [Bradymonadia bacterium]|jgi:hypothetical protein
MTDFVQIETARTAYLLDANAPLYAGCQAAGLFEAFVAKHVYVVGRADFKDGLKRIVSEKYKNLVLCGCDDSLGLLINTLRELQPNPSRRLNILLVPLTHSTRFVKKYGLGVQRNFLGMLEQLRYEVKVMKFLEIEGTLAPYIRAGVHWRALSNLDKIKLSFNASRLGTLFAQSWPSSYASLCINEAPRAFRTKKHFILESIEQEQVLLSAQVFSLMASPATVQAETKQRGATPSDMFQLHFNMRPSLQFSLHALKIPSEEFLCQRVRIEFSPHIPIHVPGYPSMMRRQLLLTSSQREFNFLAAIV